MKTYAEILTFLESAEGGGDYAEGLKAHNKEILQSRSRANDRARALEDDMRSVAEQIGAKGEDLEAMVRDAKEKSEAYTKKLTEAEQERDRIAAEKAKLEGLQEEAEQKERISAIAQKVGASAAVLRMLIKDEDLNKLVVSDDAVTIDGKPLTEWAEANHKEFIPALFPQEKKEAPKLPNFKPSVSTNPAPVSAYELATKRSGNWLNKRS